jgi:hypothetical protein
VCFSEDGRRKDDGVPTSISLPTRVIVSLPGAISPVHVREPGAWTSAEAAMTGLMRQVATASKAVTMDGYILRLF